MPHLNKILPLCAALLLTVHLTDADASEFTGSLDWSRFSMQLTDLDGSDGIDPLLTWVSQSTGASVLGGGGSTINGWGPFPPDSPLMFSNGTGTAFASANTLEVSGSGLNAGMNFLEALATRYGDFLLSPNTRVDFTVPASVFAGAPAGVDILLGASMMVFGPQGAGFAGDEISVLPGGNQARDLMVSFSNTNLVEAEVHFSSAVNVNAYATTPIPEPGQLAMLLAGLGVVVACTRRRPAA
jgi:PEP-CTERM motif